VRDLLERDVLVVAFLGLGGRGEDRRGELLRLLEAPGQLDAAHLAGLLVVLPARADEIATHHRLDRQRLQLFDDDRPATHLRLLVFACNHALRVDPGELVWHHVCEPLEPEVRHLGEHASLVGDRVGQHDVERREPVAHHDEHFVRPDGVDITHLAAADTRQAFEVRLEECLHGARVVRVGGAAKNNMPAGERSGPCESVWRDRAA